MENDRNAIWLTFDDGPEPSVTPWVLETLEKYRAKATFFCVGNNAAKHPSIIENILKAGHAVGNHTYNHLNGWQTDTQVYLSDIEKCDSILNTPLFRPPYGKIKPLQLRQLKEKYSIIMWSLITYDFDADLDKEKCLENVLNKTKNGSIVVFHDSLKAKERMQFVLPRMLEYFSKKEYNFLPIIIK